MNINSSTFLYIDLIFYFIYRGVIGVFFLYTRFSKKAKFPPPPTPIMLNEKPCYQVTPVCPYSVIWWNIQIQPPPSPSIRNKGNSKNIIFKLFIYIDFFYYLQGCHRDFFLYTRFSKKGKFTPPPIMLNEKPCYQITPVLLRNAPLRAGSGLLTVSGIWTILLYID